ncbi:antibiotic biosynthesis monooxygenase [Metapseudomonas boanensis]|uniref:Antibiotic biosynthesis monooxygenase n=1 Tax=Metapseudomonas boanensis TaxID=2822138 RepID=A0ABS5XT65_9GAMM|nr:antibiotic biosynthesis monooxygenase [Pseudomonas boanensis]MBT8769502.1 antibiotic biosynthesis monooxygenase [Pseudomonas boanensis]
MTTDDVVTLLIRHRVREGREQEYESWLRRIIGIAKGYPGHLGIDVVRDRKDGLHLFTSVLRFASTSQLQTWLDSDERRRLIEEVSHLLADGDQVEINPEREFWFTPAPADVRQPPRWKQACVTFLVILPLSLLVPLLWQPLFQLLPWLGGYLPSNVLITLSIVLLVVYLFMPPVTRFFAGWLNVR